MRKKRVIGVAASAVTVGAVVAVLATTALATPGSKQGASSTQDPFLVRNRPGIVTTSLLTTGDSVGGYRMTGIPDGLGAFDNGDGTFTVLMNHELPAVSGRFGLTEPTVPSCRSGSSTRTRVVRRTLTHLEASLRRSGERDRGR